MKKIFIAIALMLGLMSSTLSAQSLSEKLMSSLGVNEKQANGGAGTLLKYAQKSLSADDSAKVSKSIPDMSSLLAAAVAPKKSSGGFGAMASALGGDSLTGMSSVISAFSALGLDASMVQKFIPIILEYVQGSGGDDVMGILAGALK